MTFFILLSHKILADRWETKDCKNRPLRIRILTFSQNMWQINSLLGWKYKSKSKVWASALSKFSKKYHLVSNRSHMYEYHHIMYNQRNENYILNCQ